jgi:N-acetylglucosaminyl-diphospho-decaprenol L-rhamnosyltransferase
MESPEIAAVVVSFNTKHLLLECLESIQSTSGETIVETVVIDNGSEDGSSDAVLEHFPEARLISNSSNLGFARACNQGIRLTRAPFLLLLNSDARLSASSIDALYSCFSSSDKCAAAGCSLVDSSGRDRPSTWNFLTPFNQALELVGLTGSAFRSLSRSHRPRPDQNGIDCSVDWIEASCLMLRRSAAEQVGLFDERFFMYSEDEDLCWRLRRSGWLVCHSSRGTAIHRGGASAEQNPFQNLRHFYRSQYLLLLKQRGTVSARLYLLATRTALLLKWLAHRARGKQERLRDAQVRSKALKEAARSADH